jgi:hypothetical protein
MPKAIQKAQAIRNQNRSRFSALVWFFWISLSNAADALPATNPSCFKSSFDSEFASLMFLLLA